MKWLVSARISVLLFVLLAATVPGFVYAASDSEITPGTLSLVPTIECIGAVVSYTGDTDKNSSVTLEYRGPDGVWQTAPQMYADRDNSQFRGSIFWLTAGTQYEVRVTFFDNDGISGANPLSGFATTRNDNPPSSGRNLYVSTNGNDSNSGTDEAHPFKSIQKAADVVIAGDTVLVRAGTYNESVTISRSGAADNFITFKPYGAEQVTLNGDSGDNNTLLSLFTVQNAGYVRIKGFILINTAYDESYGGALRLVGANDCILEDNTLLNPGGIGAIMVRNGSSQNLVQRNTITLTRQPEVGISGIYWWKAGGANVFRNNIINDTVWGLWDGMGGGPENQPGYLYDSDFYDNTIVFPATRNPNPPDKSSPWWDRDDGIQPEGGNINVRIWGNWIQNALTGIASAPTMLGPTYIFRNVIVNSYGEAFKLGDKSYGRIYIYHNTYYTTHEADGFKQTDWGVGNIVARNNIVHAGRKVIEANTVRPDIDAFDFDYDNLFTPSETFAEYYAPDTGRGASTLEQLQLNGIEVHGFSSADDKFVNVSGYDFQLQEGSPDVDKGVVLPGFNDSGSPRPFTGSAPDLGAFEFGVSPSTGGDQENNPGAAGSSGGGGGGGGGAAGVTSLGNLITPDGKLVVGVNVVSIGADAYLIIPAGTLCKGGGDSILFWISIRPLEDNESKPYSPENAIFVSRLFKMDPEGATFDPPILLTVKYDRSRLPPGTHEENITLATWDIQEGKWIELESSVDIEHGTISAYISHFSLFTVIANIRQATIQLSGFTVTPDVVLPGETTHISVLVKNTGDLSGSYMVDLEVDGAVVQSTEVNISGGSSTTVSFNFSSANSGDYYVEIGNLSGTLKVTSPEIQTSSTEKPENIPAPAHFSISALSVSPEEARPNETVTVAALVINDGGSQGTYTAVLKVNGNEEFAREVTLDAAQSEIIYFILDKQEKGSYTVSMTDKTATFIVEEPATSGTSIKTTLETKPIGEAAPVVNQPDRHWWFIGMAIITVSIICGVVFMVVRRRNSK